MYLNSVLQSIGNLSADGTYNAEDLYRLNEAIFNLPEEDNLDADTTEALFKAVQKIKKAFAAGKCDKDPNFYYDYVGLLSTMQNQHFFSQKQTKILLEWLLEAVKSPPGEEKNSAKSAPSASKDISKLEAENAKMLKEIEQLKELASAVQVLQAFKLPKGISLSGGSGKPAGADGSGEKSSSGKRKRRGKGGGGGGGGGGGN
eukprot:TRINITY_DN13584_c0_g1_i1.p1 TRINITY_DN13584_c0_g1~~TRINITY_DN13584_c0_g1_i1.p1  ORF type:complete len:227 (+),score=70.26 TRINITY_DN13584_c0_g1_i1:77-682(+)